MDAKTLPITGPCPIDFDRSTFDQGAKQRFCDHCQKSVHNLSNMTRPEARGFLKANAGKRVCVTYKHDTDGKISYKSPAPAPRLAASDVVPVGALVRHRSSVTDRQTAPRRLPVLQARAAGIGFAAALAACTPHSNDDGLETHDPDDTVVTYQQPVIPIADPPPPDEMVVGEMMIEEPPEPPEPIVEVEGQMKIPMGDIAVPEELPEDGPEDVQAPCDPPEIGVRPYQPKDPEPEKHAVRGRIAVPRAGLR